MEKILVTLVVPCIEEEFDLLIPNFLTVEEVIRLLADAIPDITQSVYATSGNEVLCRGNPEMVLHMERTLQEHGLRHGERLYLL